MAHTQISGTAVYSKLKYESGVHRVQRVPATESQGRVHTSTATVAIMPEVDDVTVKIDAKVCTHFVEWIAPDMLFFMGFYCCCTYPLWVYVHVCHYECDANRTLSSQRRGQVVRVAKTSTRSKPQLTCCTSRPGSAFSAKRSGAS